MINLDPGIVDQNRVRKERRKRLFKTALLPLIILLVAAVIFLRPGIYNIIMSISYSNKNYSVSESVSSMQTFLNTFETYIADYNRGVSNLKLSHYEQAETDFENSLTKNPPNEMLCKIYINLSYSIEMQGDKMVNNGSYEKAVEFYNRAESVLYSNGCAGKSDGPGKDRNADTAKERIGEKRQGAAEEMAGDISNESEGQGSGEPLDDEILDDIIQKNRNNSSVQQDLRNKTGKNQGQGSGGNSSNKTRHW